MLCIDTYSYPIVADKETMAVITPPVFVLFGGTFDPIHEGHLGLVRGLLGRPEIERVFVAPAGQNPFKGAQAQLPAQLRLEMATRALAGLPGAAVLDCELRRGGPSYTIDTVSELASKYPAVVLKLAMGWDVYESFRDWRGAEALLELASLLVVTRAGGSTPAGGKSQKWLAGLPPQWRERVRMGADGAARDHLGRVILQFLNLKLPRVSSSRIRTQRDLTRVPAGARELLQAYWARPD